MVADEVFCQPLNNGERQGIPLLRVRLTNMPMFSDRSQNVKSALEIVAVNCTSRVLWNLPPRQLRP